MSAGRRIDYATFLIMAQRLAHARENPYALLTSWARESDIDLACARHEVRRQLDLVESVGFRTEDERLRFALRPADVRRIGERLHAMGMDDMASFGDSTGAFSFTAPVTQ